MGEHARARKSHPTRREVIFARARTRLSDRPRRAGLLVVWNNDCAENRENERQNLERNEELRARRTAAQSLLYI